MLVIDAAVKRFNHGGRQGVARGPSPGQLVPIGVDVLLDGILIGIAMTTGLKQGVLLTIALTLELFSLGLTMALEFIGEPVGALTKVRNHRKLGPARLSLIDRDDALSARTMIPVTAWQCTREYRSF